MSRTRQKKPEKELTETEIKRKWRDRKQQVRRLKKTIKDLEERLEKAGKAKPPTKSGKKAKPKKTDAEKLKDAREKLRQKMKEQFGGENEEK